MNPLDHPLPVSYFADHTGQAIRRDTTTLRQVADLATSTTAPTKTALPWLKLAEFGDRPTPRGSLRNNQNVVAVSGVEADYDLEALSPDDAAALLTDAGIAALIYTSPSHLPDFPRWRVLCPCSTPQPAAARADMVARLNHILGGVLSVESFTLSQSYYYGKTPDSLDHRTILVEGRYIDRVTGPTLFPKRGAADPIALPPPPPGQTPDERTRQALAVALAAFDAPGDAAGRHQVLLSATNTLAPFIKSGHLDASDAEDQLSAAMSGSGRDPNPGEVAGALEGAYGMARAYVPPTGGAEFPALPPATPRKLFVSADFRIDAHQAYVVKHLIAPGDVCALVGQPGAGKSTLAPDIAFAVAQGRPVFGMRTTPGRVLYIAAEDVRGAEKRVGALGMQHGHTDDCAVMECGNLRDADRQEEVFATIAEFKPCMVILDTIGAAFAGMVENDSQDMGLVVGFSRKIAADGVAVLLIHHPAKNGDGTPRGHSVLNGTLDMVITLAPDDVTDADTLVRGVTPKNRNGTTSREFAFRKNVVVLGMDAEGDPITTTLPVEADEQTDGQLSPAQSRALSALKGCVTTSREGRHVVPEDAWRAACDRRALTTSDKPESVARVFRRAKADLLAAGIVREEEGFVWVPLPGDEFLDHSADKT